MNLLIDIIFHEVCGWVGAIHLPDNAAVTSSTHPPRLCARLAR
jgi:hypothetical protein